MTGVEATYSNFTWLESSNRIAGIQSSNQDWLWWQVHITGPIRRCLVSWTAHLCGIRNSYRLRYLTPVCYFLRISQILLYKINSLAVLSSIHGVSYQRSDFKLRSTRPGYRNCDEMWWQTPMPWVDGICYGSLLWPHSIFLMSILLFWKLLYMFRIQIAKQCCWCWDVCRADLFAAQRQRTRWLYI